MGSTVPGSGTLVDESGSPQRKGEHIQLTAGRGISAFAVAWEDGQLASCGTAVAVWGCCERRWLGDSGMRCE